MVDQPRVGGRGDVVQQHTGQQHGQEHAGPEASGLDSSDVVHRASMAAGLSESHRWDSTRRPCRHGCAMPRRYGRVTRPGPVAGSAAQVEPQEAERWAIPGLLERLVRRFLEFTNEYQWN